MKQSLYRRQYSRFELDSSAKIVTAGQISFVTLLTDISCRGAGMALDRPLEINERVTVLLQPGFFFRSGGSKQARVVWCSRSGGTGWKAGLDFGLDNLCSFS